MYKPYYQLSWFGRNISRPISRFYWGIVRRHRKKHRATVRFAKKSPWWDHYDLYHLLYLKLDEMQDSFDRFGVCVDADKRAAQMRLVMRLLDVFYGCEPDEIIDNKYVNLRNIHRFANNPFQEKMYRQFPDELREMKAWKLIFKCLERYSIDWWD